MTELGRLMRRLDARLEEMNKIEKKAIESFERYKGAPVIDAESAQAAAAQEGG